MAKKQFDYQFEDIRREDTPVSAAGFGDMIEDPENPDEAFVDVDLDADDVANAVSAAEPKDDADVSSDGDDGAEKDGKKQRRAALEARRNTERLEQDLEEGRTEFATEVNSLKKEVASLKADNAVKDIDHEYTAQEKELTSQMEVAMEAGDSDAQSKINTKLISLASERQAKKAAAEASVSIIEDLDAEESDQPASKRAVQFIRDNQEWWSDPDHADAEDYARKLDKRLAAMGFNPESDSYWARFNHNFDKKFPDLRIADPDDIDLDLDSGANRGRTKSPVSKPGGAGGARQSTGTRKDNNSQSGSKVRLTSAHKANMIRFKLDPASPEDCAAYAREVKETERREARRAS